MVSAAQVHFHCAITAAARRPPHTITQQNTPPAVDAAHTIFMCRLSAISALEMRVFAEYTAVYVHATYGEYVAKPVAFWRRCRSVNGHCVAATYTMTNVHPLSQIFRFYRASII